MIPVSWTMASFNTEVSSFLGNPLVTGIVILSLALIMAPVAVIAVKRAVRRG